MVVRRSLLRVRVVLILFAVVAIASCTRNVEDAVVMEKEHIDAAEPSPTPTPVKRLDENPARPESGVSPEISPSPKPLQTELAPDEVAVDSYVMKKNVRGTGKDPRASTQERWLIKVETARNSRHFTIFADRAHFLKYKVGDRVKVSYKLGNYTGTVWSAKIED